MVESNIPIAEFNQTVTMLCEQNKKTLICMDYLRACNDYLEFKEMMLDFKSTTMLADGLICGHLDDAMAHIPGPHITDSSSDSVGDIMMQM